MGQPLGIVGASQAMARLGLCQLPEGVGTKELVVAGSVAGIGFTMALFIGQLAFVDGASLGVAKLSVLLGSLVAGLAGMVCGLVLLPRAPHGRRQPPMS